MPPAPFETSPLSLEIDFRGYLFVPAELARSRFPADVLAAVRRGGELWLLPLYSASSGGLLLKQRNARGDRSVLLSEQLPEGHRPGPVAAFWDERAGALRLAFGEAE